MRHKSLIVVVFKGLFFLNYSKILLDPFRKAEQFQPYQNVKYHNSSQVFRRPNPNQRQNAAKHTTQGRSNEEKKFLESTSVS